MTVTNPVSNHTAEPVSSYHKMRAYWLSEGATVAEKTQKTVMSWLHDNPTSLVFINQHTIEVEGRRYVIHETASDIRAEAKGASPEQLRAVVLLLLMPRVVLEFQQSGRPITPDLEMVSQWVTAAKAKSEEAAAPAPEEATPEVAEVGEIPEPVEESPADEVAGEPAPDQDEPVVEAEPQAEPTFMADALTTPAPPETAASEATAVSLPEPAPVRPTVRKAKPVKSASASEDEFLNPEQLLDRIEAVGREIKEQLATLRREPQAPAHSVAQSQDSEVAELKDRIAQLEAMVHRLTQADAPGCQPHPVTPAPASRKLVSAAETLVTNLGTEIPADLLRQMLVADGQLDYLNWIDQLEQFQQSNPHFSVVDCRVQVAGTRLVTYLKGSLPTLDGPWEFWQVGDADLCDPMAPTASFAMALKRLTVMYGYARDLYRKRAERESRPAGGALNPLPVETGPGVESPAVAPPPTVAAPAQPVEFVRPLPPSVPSVPAPAPALPPVPPPLPVVPAASPGGVQPTGKSRNWG